MAVTGIKGKNVFNACFSFRGVWVKVWGYNCRYNELHCTVASRTLRENNVAEGQESI